MRNNRDNTQLYRKYIAQMANAYRSRADIRVFVELLLTISAVIVFCLFAIRPTLVTIGGLVTEIDQKKQTISTMDTKIENIVKAQELFGREADRLALLETAVPRQPELTEFIIQIEAIALKNSVSIYGITTTGVNIYEAPSAGQKSVGYIVTFTGAYTNLLSTLNDIENLRRPSDVGSAGFSLDTNTEVPALFLSVEAMIPYRP